MCSFDRRLPLNVFLAKCDKMNSLPDFITFTLLLVVIFVSESDASCSDIGKKIPCGRVKWMPFCCEPIAYLLKLF